MTTIEMKRALHRSVVFWLGCLVLAFLVWAWVSSYKTGTSLLRTVSIEKKGAGFRFSYDEGVKLENGRLKVYLVSVSKPWVNASVVNEEAIYMRYAPEAVDKAPGFRGTSYHDTAVRMATVRRSLGEVPVWAVVALYVMGCGGVLVWQRRRWRRVMAAEVVR